MRSQKSLNLTARAFALAITCLVGASCVDSNHRNQPDVSVSQPPTGPTAMAALPLMDDKDEDGVPGLVEIDQVPPGFVEVEHGCSKAATLLATVYPSVFYLKEVKYSDKDGNVVTIPAGTIEPGAPELCDGKDNDCDGLVDEGLGPDGQPLQENQQDLPQPDSDGDGVGNCADTDDDGDGDPDETDCEPLDASVNNDADELCNTIDDDCDGDTDEPGAANCTKFYIDVDEDGFGSSELPAECLCAPILDQDLTATHNGDCDDGDVMKFPFNPEICDGKDNNCNGTVDDEFTDTDLDGSADCDDGDDDEDGVSDTEDNCSLVVNPEQTDTDSDGKGDACDLDDDGDGVPDTTDNCPLHVNPEQTDSDEDGLGDACDTDVDDDGVGNDIDNCLVVVNPEQTDTDSDGKGDACDLDDDGDGVPDATDNCDLVVNVNQADKDGDALGDLCDLDDDGDGVPDATDNCPLVSNANQADTNSDGIGDACETDDDGDGDPDLTDCAPTNPAIHHGAAEVCNGKDDDCDGTTDENFLDTDGDGIANCVEVDSDNDGVPDSIESTDPQCPANAAVDDEVWPGNPADVCDEKDNDCNGIIDDNPGLGGTKFYFDMDQDGEGKACNDFLQLCSQDQTTKYTATQCGDCDDASAARSHLNTEVCGNNIDEDCSGTANACVCTPSCNGKVCGSDGCGGACGNCAANQQCKADQSACVPLVVPEACADGIDNDGDGKIDCADPDCGTDFTHCPQCTTAAQCNDNNANTTDTCQSGQCVHSPVGCTPSCTGKVCGLDGCGGTCGPCSGNTPFCNATQAACVECTSTSQCAVGKSCINGSCLQTTTTCTTDGNCQASEYCGIAPSSASGQCFPFANQHGQTADGESGLGGGTPEENCSGPKRNCADGWDSEGDCECSGYNGTCHGSSNPACVTITPGDCDDTSTGLGNGKKAQDFAGDKYDNDCNGIITCSSSASCLNGGVCLNGACTVVTCEVSSQCSSGTCGTQLVPNQCTP